MRKTLFIAPWLLALAVLGCGDSSAGLGGGAAGTAGRGGEAAGGVGGAAGTGGVGGVELFDCGGLQFEQRALYGVRCRLDLDLLLEPVVLDLTAKVYGKVDAGPLKIGESAQLTTCGDVALPQDTVNLIGNFGSEVSQGFVDFSVTNAVPDTIEHEVPVGSVEASVVISVETTVVSMDRAGDLVVEPSLAEIAILVPLGNGIPIDLSIPGDSCGGFVLQDGSAPLRFEVIEAP